MPQTFETCGFVLFPPRPKSPWKEKARARVEPSQGAKPPSCPCLCRVRAILFSELSGGRRVPVALYDPTVQGEKHPSHGASRVFEQDTGPGGEGASPFRRRSRQIGSGHRQSRRCHVLAGQARTLPGFRAPLVRWRVREEERRAEAHLCERHFWDSSVPSGASGLAGNVVGWQGPVAEAFRTCSSRAGRPRPCSSRVGDQSTASMDGLGPCVPLLRVLCGANSTPTAGRNWVPAAVTSRSRTLGSGGGADIFEF